ncbi:MAG: hypothetical protein EOM41_00745 [Bacilli bacterium]|nr:hypothetical protein [Bacilli bacterium]
MINTISAKEALRLLNYWQNTKWEIDKQERDLDKLKAEYLIKEDLFDLIYSHVSYCPEEELTCQDFAEAIEGAQTHLNMFYKPKGIPVSELESWINDARIKIREDTIKGSFNSQDTVESVIDIFIKRPKDEALRNKEIKDLENYIDNLKEKYNNILEELKRFNIVT